MIVEARRQQCEQTGCCAICFGPWMGDGGASGAGTPASGGCKPNGAAAKASKRPRLADDDDMIACDACGLWVHVACEQLPPGSSAAFADDDATYLCPYCSSEPPGRGAKLLERCSRRALGASATDPTTNGLRVAADATAAAAAAVAAPSASSDSAPGEPRINPWTLARKDGSGLATGSVAAPTPALPAPVAPAAVTSAGGTANFAAFRAAVAAAAASAVHLPSADGPPPDASQEDPRPAGPVAGVIPARMPAHELPEMYQLPGGSVPLARATIAPAAAHLPVYGVPCPGFVFDPVSCSYVSLGDEASGAAANPDAASAARATKAPGAAEAASNADAGSAPGGADSSAAEKGNTAAAVAAAVAASEATRARYEACAAAFEPLTADNVERKMAGFNTALEAVYGDLPFTRLDWSTSVLGTLVGLICAQTCKNSWSSIGYASLAAARRPLGCMRRYCMHACAVSYACAALLDPLQPFLNPVPTPRLPWPCGRLPSRLQVRQPGGDLSKCRAAQRARLGPDSSAATRGHRAVHLARPLLPHEGSWPAAIRFGMDACTAAAHGWRRLPGTDACGGCLLTDATSANVRLTASDRASVHRTGGAHPRPARACL